MISNYSYSYRNELNLFQKKFIQCISPILLDSTTDIHEFEERVNEFFTQNKEIAKRYTSELVMLNGRIKGIETIIIAHKAV